MAKSTTTRFEFIFTSLNPGSTKLFTTVIAVHRYSIYTIQIVVFNVRHQKLCRAYETTKLYRELKMRGAILNDDELKLLPQEEKFNKVRKDVANLQQMFCAMCT